MNQLNCDIIKDLMPSYLDNLCSDSSRKAVEDHLPVAGPSWKLSVPQTWSARKLRQSNWTS